MCSLNMGSTNFNISRGAERITRWKHAWEKPCLASTVNHIVRNTFGEVEGIVAQLGKSRGTRLEFACYDIGHLYTLAHMLDRKVVEPPLFVQNIFGILGGMGTEIRNLHVAREPPTACSATRTCGRCSRPDATR